MAEDKEPKGLCYRCEYRAQFLETGRQPRCECGSVNSANYSCYMYKPTCPVVTQPSDSTDPRPRFGPAMVSSRECAVRPAKPGQDVELNLCRVTASEAMLYWVPIKKKVTKRRKRVETKSEDR